MYDLVVTINNTHWPAYRDSLQAIAQRHLFPAEYGGTRKTRQRRATGAGRGAVQIVSRKTLVAGRGRDSKIETGGSPTRRRVGRYEGKLKGENHGKRPRSPTSNMRSAGGTLFDWAPLIHQGKEGKVQRELVRGAPRRGRKRAGDRARCEGRRERRRSRGLS